MSEPNEIDGLERDLEKVFRAHEHRIEDELHKMSQSFEMCTQTPDITLMSNFFEYLNYRLVATCKKIEVDYFAKKAERPNDSIDVILNDDKRKTIEILDTTGSINDQGNNAIDQNLDDEDELHGEWEKEQLRIVEDYHSNSSLDAISSNEQCDSLEVKSESSTVKQNITSGSDKSHNTSNSSNRSMGLMYSSETDVDYNAAKKTNLSRKRSKSPDDSKAQSKKHKGFDDALKDLEDGEILDTSDSKNTNRNVYHMNPQYRFKCMLCENFQTNLIDHLKKTHPEMEVYIARPSPEMAEKIRNRSEYFTYTQSTAQIFGICFFCQQPRRMAPNDWKDHLLYHTGESRSALHGSADDKMELTAFMCNECNYTQMDRNRLRKHLLYEHGKSKEEIDDNINKIVLIPNLTPLEPIQTKHIEYVAELSRFKCGIGWCEVQSGSYSQFKAHLRQKHNNSASNESFVCFHCSEIIKPNGNSFVHDVTEHLKLHGTHLFWCVFCKMAFSSEINIMLHIIHNHAMKKIRFRHDARKITHTNSESIEEFIVMLQCNKCNQTFYTFTKASNHFKQCHGSLNIDFTASKLIKNTVIDSMTTLGLNKHPMIIRQFFKCSMCDETRFNETSLIKHFTKSHRTRALTLQPGKVFLKYTDETEPIEIGTNSIRTVFYCYICYENGGQFVGHASVQDLFGHWFSTHSEPFCFVKADIAKCHHCKLMGTYQGLNCHHFEAHPTEIFAMVDIIIPDKCALCQHSGQDIEEHFKRQHASIADNNVFCPIPLNDASLNELIDMKGQKKRKCDYCHEVFDDKSGFEMHHTIKHSLFKAKSNKFYDNETIHLITGCCDTKLNPDQFFQHLIEHDFPVKCSLCNFEASDIQKFKTHNVNCHDGDNNVERMYFQTLEAMLWKIYFKTKIKYGNGLILNKHNLVGTNRDDRQEFKHFVEMNLRERQEKL